MKTVGDFGVEVYSMSRDKKKGERDLKRRIKRQIAAHVKNAFPDCVAEFCGQQSSAALVSRTFGFRVRDQGGRYRSNIVWVYPDYNGEIDEAWVRWAVTQSNG